MNPLFEVSEQEIENLNQYQFADILNRLLKAEAQRYGIPPLSVTTTLRINDPDGGVDARVEPAVNLPDTCRIPEGLSVWQYKAGEIGPKDIREIESQKPGVQAAIQADGWYYFVVGKGYSDVERRNRLAAVNHCYVERGLTPKGRLLTAQDVADWVSAYPAVAMQPYFGRPVHDELLTFEGWQNLAELRVAYVNFEVDDQRQRIINEIGNLIASQVEFKHIGIVGRTGIGKTRLILEAIRANGLEYNTLYVCSPQGIPTNLFSYIEANLNIRLILVVDECTFDNATRLHRRAQRCGDRLLLITVGHEHQLAIRLNPSFPLFGLDRLADESIQRIVRQISPTMPQELVSFIIRASGGYVKLATAMAESLARNPNLLGAVQLTGVPDIRHVLETLVPDPSDRRVMEALSLLQHIGLDDEVAQEGQVVANFMGIDFRELKRVAEKMRQSGLVVKRGRYRYVSPHLLAVWFATEVWQARGEDIVNDLLLAENGLPTLDAKGALLERLADLGEEDVAAPVVEKLLGPDGLFADIEVIDHSIRSQVFAILVRAAPKVGAAALERILGHLPRDRLLEFRAGRRQIIWTLERLLYLETTFWIAARLLLKLAEAENETVLNNASGTWTEIFFTHLSGTPIPAVERHRLIREALNSPYIETRLLAVRAIRTALSLFESRMGGSRLGGHIISAEWRPKTWGELREVRRSALNLLDQALNDQETQVIEAAREALIGATIPIVRQGLADEILPRLQNLPLRTDLERQAMWELLQQILHYEGEILTKEQQETIKQWIQVLIGDDFRNRVRRWVGKVSLVDRQELRDAEKSPEEMAAMIAEEGFQNPEALRAELTWLASSEALHFYFFGRRLGQLDTEHAWLEDLVAQIRNGGNPGLLSGYLQGCTDSGEGKWVEQLLDEWTQNNQELAYAVFDATWRRGGTDSSAARVILLIDKGWLPPIALGQLAWGGWINPLSADTMASLLQRLIADESPPATEAALALLLRWLESHPHQSDAMSEYALPLLERPSALRSQGMFLFYWKTVTRFYLPRFSINIAQAILNLFISSNFLVISQDDRMVILREALLHDPERIWPLIGDVLLREDEVAYRFSLAVEELGIDEVGTPMLLEWAEQHKPQGAYILARIAQVGGIPLTSLPRELLIQYGEDDTIGRLLKGNFLSGLIVGSEVAWLESKLELARQWQNDEHPGIRGWANEVVSHIETKIKRVRQQEEELELWF